DQERPDRPEAPSRQGPQAPDGFVRALGPGPAGHAGPGGSIGSPRSIGSDRSEMEQRFRAAAHIRQRRDFQTVYDTGRKLHGRTMTIFALSRPGTGSRLGIAATRKLGSAVERNRAKRLIRELFRLNPAPPGLDIVVVPR